eukprot:2020595-Pyramimonas_sp.AAC.1
MKGIPNKGKGTDAMNMDDVRRLPEHGRQAYIDVHKQLRGRGGVAMANASSVGNATAKGCGTD